MPSMVCENAAVWHPWTSSPVIAIEAGHLGRFRFDTCVRIERVGVFLCNRFKIYHSERPILQPGCERDFWLAVAPPG